MEFRAKFQKYVQLPYLSKSQKTLPYYKLPYYWFSLKDHHIKITIFLYGNICELPYFWNMVIKIGIW